MKDKKSVSTLYREFAEAEGNQHIASQYAVIKLQELIRMFRIKSVLEVGLGIGCISGILLELNKDLKYLGTESNNFCLEALKKNVEQYEKLQIFEGIEKVPENDLFDMVIVDGKDPSLEEIGTRLSPHGILAIEGDRTEQHRLLMQLFPDAKYVHSISLRKNKSYSPFPKEEWQGGIKIIFTNPNLKQNVWWLMEKIKTKLKYHYPERHFGKKPRKV